jgi:competence protein ComEC
MGWGIGIILRVARFVGGLPHALIEISPSPGYAVALVAVGLALLGLFRSGARFSGLVPVVLGLVAMTLGRPPDVLVSPTANLIGVRDAGVVRIVQAGRVDKFTLDQWRPVWAGMTSKVGRIGDVCDGGRCLAAQGRVLILADRDAARAGCGDALIVISPRPLRGACRKPGRVVIDRFTVWRDGAVAVRLTKRGAMIRTDRTVQGDRPWVPPWPRRWHRR